MGMANEIEQLEYAILLIKQDGKDYLDERDIPILETAIDTMRKYQKIEQIYKEWFSDAGHTSAEAYGRIGEVLKNGNDDWWKNRRRFKTLFS